MPETYAVINRYDGVPADLPNGVGRLRICNHHTFGGDENSMSISAVPMKNGHRYPIDGEKLRERLNAQDDADDVMMEMEVAYKHTRHPYLWPRDDREEYNQIQAFAHVRRGRNAITHITGKPPLVEFTNAFPPVLSRSITDIMRLYDVHRLDRECWELAGEPDTITSSSYGTYGLSWIIEANALWWRLKAMKTQTRRRIAVVLSPTVSGKPRQTVPQYAKQFRWWSKKLDTDDLIAGWFDEKPIGGERRAYADRVEPYLEVMR